jgi:hypothetical protein
LNTTKNSHRPRVGRLEGPEQRVRQHEEPDDQHHEQIDELGQGPRPILVGIENFVQGHP